VGKAETSKKLKCRDKRQRRRNISQARRWSFKAILCMRITGGERQGRFRVDIRGGRGIGAVLGLFMRASKPLWRACRPKPLELEY
jgi:hypothetical protein